MIAKSRHCKPAERRADGSRQVIRRAVERNGIWYFGGGHQFRNDRLPGGIVHRGSDVERERRPSKTQGEITPQKVSTLRMATVASIQVCQKMSSLRLS